MAVKEDTDEVVEQKPKGGVEVNLDEPDEGVDDEPAPGPSRREKKASRYRENNERAERAEREAAELRSQIATLNERTAFLAGRIQDNGKPPPDPDDAELEAVRREQELLVKEFQIEQAAGRIDEAKQKEYRAKGYALRDRETRAIHRQEGRRNAPTPQQQAAQRIEQQFTTRYPDVAANPRASEWVGARYKQMILQGHANDWGTMDLVVEEARNLGRPAKREQDPTLGRKLEGISRGASGGPAPSGNVRLTEQDKAMADAAYGHLPPEKRYAHFAKTTLARRQAKAG